MTEKVIGMTESQAERILKELREQKARTKELAELLREVYTEHRAAIVELVNSLKNANSFPDLKRSELFRNAGAQVGFFENMLDGRINSFVKKKD